MEKEHTNLKEQLKQLQGAKNKLASQMNHLSVSDKHYDKKYQDMQELDWDNESTVGTCCLLDKIK